MLPAYKVKDMQLRDGVRAAMGDRLILFRELLQRLDELGWQLALLESHVIENELLKITSVAIDKAANEEKDGSALSS